MSLYIKEKPEYLKQAIQSMLNQTYQPDEIVIVKDGKITNELQIVLDEYKDRYPKTFNVVGYEKNKGLGLALEYGLKYCKNELIARMDTDDVAVKNRCEVQLDFLQKNPEITIVGGQIEEFMGEIDNIIGKRVVPEKHANIIKYMKKRCPFNHMTVMFRKQDVLDVGSYQDWHYNEDYYLWIRLVMAGKKFANLSDILVKVRVDMDMYQRRGGKKYFVSERNIQRLMLKNDIIGYPRYILNISERLVLQIFMPNWLRKVTYMLLARK